MKTLTLLGRLLAILGGLIFLAMSLIALGSDSWTDAFESFAFAMACFLAAYTGVDPHNPAGLHRTMRLTRRRAPALDEAPPDPGTE